MRSLVVGHSKLAIVPGKILVVDRSLVVVEPQAEFASIVRSHTSIAAYHLSLMRQMQILLRAIRCWYTKIGHNRPYATA